MRVYRASAHLCAPLWLPRLYITHNLRAAYRAPHYLASASATNHRSRSMWRAYSYNNAISSRVNNIGISAHNAAGGENINGETT